MLVSLQKAPRPRWFYACLFSLAAGMAAQSNAAASLPTSDYHIGKGDVLQVAVWGEPQLSQRVVVRPDGKISLPLLSDISIDDNTARQAETTLTASYSKYLKHPQVSVIVAEVHSKFVYVTGEVERPGAYPVLAPITIVQLIARAGGLTRFAKSKQMYVLKATSGPRIKVNYKAVLQGHTEQNLDLASGDTVVIP